MVEATLTKEVQVDEDLMQEGRADTALYFSGSRYSLSKYDRIRSTSRITPLMEIPRCIGSGTLVLLCVDHDAG